ncbi:hypothetical protein MMC34_008358, partial [Xylographa carneopallida]|nr:hypothetical protein [Xylographa carneopallida]
SEQAVSLGRLHLLGGYGTGQQWSELLSLSLDDPLGPLWTRAAVAGPVPCERYSHTMSAVGGALVLFGGLSANGSSSWLNDLHTLDTATPLPSSTQHDVMSWCQPACPQQLGHIPSPRAGHTMNVLPGERLVVFGGGNANGPTNDLHILDTQAMVWSRPDVYGTPPSPRAGHTACTVFGAELLVFGGGYLNKVFNDLHLFNSHTGVWSRPSDTGTVPIPRAGHTSTVIGSRIYTFAGGDAEDVFNDLHLLDTSFFRMTQLDTHTANAHSSTHSSVPPDEQRSDARHADTQRATALLSHSASAPTSPQPRTRRGSEALDARERVQEGDERRLAERLDDYAASTSAMLAATVRQLDSRHSAREEEEAELLRLLAATRERRLREYRAQSEELRQLQLGLAQRTNDMREALARHTLDQQLQRQAQTQRTSGQAPEARELAAGSSEVREVSLSQPTLTSRQGASSRSKSPRKRAKPVEERSLLAGAHSVLAAHERSDRGPS